MDELREDCPVCGEPLRQIKATRVPGSYYFQCATLRHRGFVDEDYAATSAPGQPTSQAMAPVEDTSVDTPSEVAEVLERYAGKSLSEIWREIQL